MAGHRKLQRSEPEAALADLDAVAARDEERSAPRWRSCVPRRCSRSAGPRRRSATSRRAPASALDAELLAVRGKARLELGRPGEALADAKHALELHATHDAARELLLRSFLAVAATIAPPGLEANRTLVGESELESAWSPDQRNAISTR